MTGKIFNVQRFCTNDGPGIRTTVFLKGCPLHCLWCHNPESQEKKSQLAFDSNKCLHCFRCASLCEQGCHTEQLGKHRFARQNCVTCGNCLKAGCAALEVIGEEMSVGDVLAVVLKDKKYYDNSGGGITLSGGEPLLQADFCLEMLKKAKQEGLHICLETCGFADRETVKRSAEFVDLYLYDYKESNPDRHKQFTGVDNRLILENLRYLDSLGKAIILRCPIIPGYNDTVEHFKGIAELANQLQNVKKIEVEPYNSLGESKYPKLDMDYKVARQDMPTGETAKLWAEQIQSQTKVKVFVY